MTTEVLGTTTNQDISIVAMHVGQVLHDRARQLYGALPDPITINPDEAQMMAAYYSTLNGAIALQQVLGGVVAFALEGAANTANRVGERYRHRG